MNAEMNAETLRHVVNNIPPNRLDMKYYGKVGNKIQHNDSILFEPLSLADKCNTSSQACDLFFLECWPKKFQNMYITATTPEEKHTALRDRVEYLIKTGS